jgi:hypothetical protein
VSSTVSSRPPAWPAISPAVRDASKPSGLTIGTTMLRELRTTLVARASPRL